MTEEKEFSALGDEGKFVSPFPNYPGYIQLPYPFMGRHYKLWLRASRSHAKDAEDDIDKLPAFGEWAGAVALILKWAIEGVPEQDVSQSGDNVPVELQVWVRETIGEYLAWHFDSKNWHGQSEIS